VDRTDLGRLLVEAGVPSDWYSLDGLALQSEALSLVQDESGWRVVYKERGESTLVAAGLTEGDACTLMHRELMDVLAHSRRMRPDDQKE
jgi:hypothetical protein